MQRKKSRENSNEKIEIVIYLRRKCKINKIVKIDNKNRDVSIFFIIFYSSYTRLTLMLSTI